MLLFVLRVLFVWLHSNHIITCYYASCCAYSSCGYITKASGESDAGRGGDAREEEEAVVLLAVLVQMLAATATEKDAVVVRVDVVVEGKEAVIRKIERRTIIGERTINRVKHDENIFAGYHLPQ